MDTKATGSSEAQEAAERHRNAVKAGSTKRPATIKALDAKLAKLADDVLEGRVDKSVAAVVTQIINSRIKLLQMERQIKEHDDMVERITSGRSIPW